MIKLGNFLFHYRNFLFPVFYALLFVPSPFIFSSHITAIVVGLVIALTGQIIRAITIGLQYIIRGGKDRRVYAEELVTGGIFKHCRNPLYVGNILILFGLGFVANSWVFVLLIGPLFVFFYQAIVRAEEDFLHKKFGTAYEAYCRDVNRWLPNFTGLGTTLSEMKFNWKRFILKEYNSTFMWMGAAVLVSLKNFYFAPLDVPFQASFPYLIAIFIVLALGYGIIRFLKKSKRMTYS